MASWLVRSSPERPECYRNRVKLRSDGPLKPVCRLYLPTLPNLVALLILICVSFYHYSAIAVNLKACNHFRLYNGKAAEVRFASVCLTDSPGGGYSPISGI